jgi:mRNA interferase HigB
MRIVGRETLDRFCSKHADARKWIASWLVEVEASTWTTPQAVKDRYVTASFLEGNTVIFNVKGDDYRLEVVVAYRTGIVSVKWVGTHADYAERNSKLK